MDAPVAKRFFSVLVHGCRHASKVDQLFGEHGIINQMVATPIGAQSGRRFTRGLAGPLFSQCQKTENSACNLRRVSFQREMTGIQHMKFYML